MKDGSPPSYNKAYVLRSLVGRLAMRHIAQKTARRRISKTLSEIAPCMPETSVTVL